LCPFVLIFIISKPRPKASSPCVLIFIIIKTDAHLVPVVLFEHLPLALLPEAPLVPFVLIFIQIIIKTRSAKEKVAELYKCVINFSLWV